VSKEEGHLTNEVFFVTNEKYVNTVINDEESQDGEFEETIRDAKMRLDLYKH
jgi:hypothetical protein